MKTKLFTFFPLLQRTAGDVIERWRDKIDIDNDLWDSSSDLNDLGKTHLVDFYINTSSLNKFNRKFYKLLSFS